MSSGGSASVRGRGAVAAWAAFAVGVVYAGVSMVWGLGSTWLLDTVGGTFDTATALGAAALKVGAAVLGVVVVMGRTSTPSALRRWAQLLTWTAAVVLTLYGGVLTVVGLLAQAGVIDPAADADRKALRWHAFLWDPWFLVWGLLLTFALWVSRPPKTPRRTGRRAMR